MRTQSPGTFYSIYRMEYCILSDFTDTGITGTDAQVMGTLMVWKSHYFAD